MASRNYKYYQPNKKDLKDKYGDCVIRALTKVTGKEWMQVFDELLPYARELQCMKDWEREANGNCQYSWYDYAKPGDLVDESVFIYFMDVTTPRIYRDGYLQVGAPYSRVMDDEMGTERDTFPTFERVEKGVYRFCGNCFAGETKHIE